MSLNLSISVAMNKNNVTQSFVQSQTAAMDSAGYKVLSPVLGTSTQQISTATIEVAGYAFVRSLVTNTPATNTVTIGRLDGTTLHEFVQLRPGEPAVLRLAAGDIGAKAAAEDSRILLGIFED